MAYQRAQRCEERRRPGYAPDGMKASYCQKLVTRVSGCAFHYLFSALKFDASNDLGELVRAIQTAPCLAGRLAQFEDHRERRLAAEAALG